MPGFLIALALLTVLACVPGGRWALKKWTVIVDEQDQSAAVDVPPVGKTTKAGWEGLY